MTLTTFSRKITTQPHDSIGDNLPQCKPYQVWVN